MSFLFWATILLMLAAATYYLVFAMLIYYWHEKEMSVMVIPLIFTFEFFVAGFLLVAFVSLLLAYFPEFLQFSSFVIQQQP
ncbi:MAG: hypothetical protein ACREHG_07155 [Candidatus Saccharimonadales bacterium]